MGVNFIHDDWLLDTPQAAELFHRHAAAQPIIDYHNHLPPQEIAQNRTFESIGEVWLSGDHYKWRAMRANGIPESLVTGDAPWRDKFQAWAETMPFLLGSPLYAWTHLELVRHFGITEALNGESAERIWSQANERLAELSVWRIFEMFNVKVVGTTDDPADTLAHHEAIRASACPALVAPTFRPDRLLNPAAEGWADSVRRLAAEVGRDIHSEETLQEALAIRLAQFYAAGGRATDHGLSAPSRQGSRQESARRLSADAEDLGAFEAALQGEPATMLLQHRLATAGLRGVWAEAARLGMAAQIHAGAKRSASTRLAAIGPDTGGDTMGAPCDLNELAEAFDRLDQHGALPRVILYCNNPADNLPFATLAATFCDGLTPAKLQLGPAWWHLDQADGIEENLRATMNVGLLRRHVGMTTDSRSFLSFPRHEYFRRILCRMLGRMMAAGELPGDTALVGAMTAEICFSNAQELFGFEIGRA